MIMQRSRPEEVLRDQLLGVYASYAGFMLDIGCGTGEDIELWNQHRIHRVHAVDIDANAIEKAKEKQASRGPSMTTVTFTVGDCVQPETFGSGPYDVVSCMMTLQHIASRESVVRSFLQGVSSVLRYYGKFIGIVPVLTGDEEPGLKYHSSASFGRQCIRRQCMREGVNPVPEYIVDMEALKAVAKTCCLDFVQSVVTNGYRTFVFTKHDPMARL